MAARVLHLLPLLLVTAALGYQLPLSRTVACPRARTIICDAADTPTDGEEPATAETAADDPKAAAKEEKKALREAIANLEATLPGLRGELNAAEAAKKDAGENGYMLLAANFERYRQQANKEMELQKGYGRQNTLRALLPFIEQFEELQTSAGADAGEGSAIHSYYGGIWKQTQKLFADWEVEPFEAAAGETFDFNLHQTVSRIPSEDVPAGVIIEAQERGWKCGDAALRQAKVVVSTGPTEAPPEAEAPAAEAEAAPAEAEADATE